MPPFGASQKTASQFRDKCLSTRKMYFDCAEFDCAISPLSIVRNEGGGKCLCEWLQQLVSEHNDANNKNWAVLQVYQDFELGEKSLQKGGRLRNIADQRFYHLFNSVVQNILATLKFSLKSMP